MIYRRERPRCRMALLRLCMEYDCSLEGLLNHPFILLSKGLKVQAKKMISEGNQTLEGEDETAPL